VDEALALPGSPVPRLLRRPDGDVLRLDVELGGRPGFLRAVFRADELGRLLRPRELGEDAVMVLGDREGGLVAASGAGATLASFPPELVAAARSGAVSGSGRYIRGRTGAARVVGAHAPVAGSGWFVLSRQSTAFAERVAGRMRRRFLLSVLAAVGLSGLLSGLAYVSVVRPLREIAAAQRRLAPGAEEHARGKDEIGEIKSNLALLERQSLDREAAGSFFLGRFEVLSVVGSGGMGTVFKGFDPRLRRLVALKTIRFGPTTTLDTQGQEMPSLLREAITVARVSHPNVVGVYDAEDSPAGTFIAMEFVDGTTLARLVMTKGALLPSQLGPLGAAIARGLAAVHAEGVLHRDVKPANVLLGRDGAIKVTDFGIAALVSARSGESGEVLGTPGYMPPETVKRSAYDARSDLFGLGVMLHEAALGRRLYPGKTLVEVARRMSEPPAALPALRPGFPEELDRLIRRLLAPEPDERPSSAADVAELLETLSMEYGWRWRAEALGLEPAPDKESDTHALVGLLGDGSSGASGDRSSSSGRGTTGRAG
jgi:serine/threonine-protein kinase